MTDTTQADREAQAREAIARIIDPDAFATYPFDPDRCEDFIAAIEQAAEDALAKAAAILAVQTPIAMLLFCPKCGEQHIDEPDERNPDWDNPPHRSHLCHDCGCIWRPADVATVGVARIETTGKADTWDVYPGPTGQVCEALAWYGDPPGDMTAVRVDQGASEALGEMVWHVPSASPPVQAGEVERDMSGETVAGFRVAAYRETHPEHGDKYGHTYSEHWSTPNTRDPRVTVERLFTEQQLREALSTPVSQPLEDRTPHATNAMLDAGVGEMRVSTHADRGVALDVWNAMHRAGGIEDRIRADERERLATWLEEQRNDVPACGWEIAATLRQSGAERGETP